MILEAYKYNLDELYVQFKGNLHDILYNVEMDDDLTDDEIKLFKNYIEHIKYDFEKT